jgi:HEAT repeat protein
MPAQCHPILETESADGVPKNAAAAASRAEAVRCLGLYCLLPDAASPDQDAPSSMGAVGASQRVALLRAALVADPDSAVREAAAMALCDLALLRRAA